MQQRPGNYTDPGLRHVQQCMGLIRSLKGDWLNGQCRARIQRIRQCAPQASESLKSSPETLLHPLTGVECVRD